MFKNSNRRKVAKSMGSCITLAPELGRLYYEKL